MSAKQELVNKALDYTFDTNLDYGLNESSLKIAHSMILTIPDFEFDSEEILQHHVDNWKDYVRKSKLN